MNILARLDNGSSPLTVDFSLGGLADVQEVETRVFRTFDPAGLFVTSATHTIVVVDKNGGEDALYHVAQLRSAAELVVKVKIVAPQQQQPLAHIPLPTFTPLPTTPQPQGISPPIFEQPAQEHQITLPQFKYVPTASGNDDENPVKRKKGETHELPVHSGHEDNNLSRRHQEKIHQNLSTFGKRLRCLYRGESTNEVEDEEPVDEPSASAATADADRAELRALMGTKKISFESIKTRKNVKRLLLEVFGAENRPMTLKQLLQALNRAASSRTDMSTLIQYVRFALDNSRIHYMLTVVDRGTKVKFRDDEAYLEMAFVSQCIGACGSKTTPNSAHKNMLYDVLPFPVYKDLVKFYTRIPQSDPNCLMSDSPCRKRFLFHGRPSHERLEKLKRSHGLRGQGRRYAFPLSTESEMYLERSNADKSPREEAKVLPFVGGTDVEPVAALPDGEETLSQADGVAEKCVEDEVSAENVDPNDTCATAENEEETPCDDGDDEEKEEEEEQQVDHLDDDQQEEGVAVELKDEDETASTPHVGEEGIPNEMVAVAADLADVEPPEVSDPPQEESPKEVLEAEKEEEETSKIEEVKTCTAFVKSRKGPCGRALPCRYHKTAVDANSKKDEEVVALSGTTTGVENTVHVTQSDTTVYDVDEERDCSVEMFI